MDLLEEMKRAGWDPFDPSEECRKATELPAMMSHLSSRDRLGIYHGILLVTLCCRFGKGTSYLGERGKILDVAAVLFALRQTDQWEGLIPEKAQHWANEIRRWRETVFVPANERMERTSPQEVLANPLAYEPALTVAWFNVNSGLIDPELDRFLMGKGRAMHEADSDRPRALVDTSEEELQVFHGWLTADGRTIARITDEGKIEIDPYQVKSGLDASLGRVLQAKGALDEGVPAEADLEEIREAVSAREQVELIESLRIARLGEAKPESARWHVLQNFFEILRQQVTYRELGERVGLSPSALQEAFEAERKAISKELDAA